MIELVESTWNTFGVPGIIGLAFATSMLGVLVAMLLVLSDD